MGVGAYSPVVNGVLVASKDPRFATRTRFEGPVGDWVWDDPALRVSGVTVAGVASSSYTVDYVKGAIVFAAPVAASAEVRASYCARAVSVIPADGPWFLSLMDGEGKPPAAENRISLPAVAIEAALGTSSYPWELGNTTMAYTVPLMLHVVANSPAVRNRIHDMLCKQKDAVLVSFDRNKIEPPLDALGRLTTGARAYPALCADFPWEPIRLTNCRPSGASRVGEGLWLATVRMDCEVVVA